jgi:hypothetical protein
MTEDQTPPAEPPPEGGVFSADLEITGPNGETQFCRHCHWHWVLHGDDGRCPKGIHLGGL